MVRAPGIDLGGLGFNSLSGHITFNTKTIKSAQFTNVADLVLDSVRETRIEVVMQSAITISLNLGRDLVEVDHIAIYAMGVSFMQR